IPGGERFVVKSLHDTPVESYLSKEKARHEAAIKKAKYEIESVNREIRATKNKLSLYRDNIKQVKAFVEHIDEADLSYFADVMTGRMNYAVKGSYRVPSIEEFSEYMSIIDNYYGNSSYKGMRMLSVLGNSDGKIAFKVNQWSDGSGSYYEVKFFETYEEARDYVKQCVLNLLDEDCLRIEEFRSCQNMGIEFSHEEMLLIRNKLHDGCNKALENLSATFMKQKEKIDSDKEFIDKQINK
ncbi:MAG: hypothetical protein RSB25_22635, partial [Acinetobacter sp.]